MTTTTVAVEPKTYRMKPRTRNILNGLLFASPWLIGLSLFWIYPTIMSAYYSFTKFNGIQTPIWVGFRNYTSLFTNDIDFLNWPYSAVTNTLYFAAVSIPLAIVMAFALALMLNAKIRGQVIYRTIYFLPTLVPEVALALVWVYMFTPVSGIVNVPWQMLGRRGPCWLTCPQMARETLILMALWIIGQQVILYLAGLQDVPQDLYDAASVDGANPWHRFRHVTLPILTPVIFFHLVTSVIGALQFFAIPYIMTGGNGFPANSTLFYSIYMYKTGFQYFEFGVASAMAWMLFVVTLLVTLVIFRSANLWVFYGSGEDK